MDVLISVFPVLMSDTVVLFLALNPDILLKIDLILDFYSN